MANKTLIDRKNFEKNRVCDICGKKVVVSFNRPHSLHKTKRVIKPNLQKQEGRLICTRCLRTQIKKS